MATWVPMRKVAFPALVLIVLIAAWWAVRDEGGPAADRDGARSATQAFERMKERVNSFSSAPLPEATGALEIRGTVLGPDGPIAGAAVTATQPVQGGPLSTLECDCPEAAAQVGDLVAQRRGEAPPIARATTDASGHYALRGLEPGSYTLWADARIGVAARDSVQAGDAAADIQVARSRTISGMVRGDNYHPLAGAVVTAIHATYGRFFDAISGPDGDFSIGPLPPGKLQVVASGRDLLPSTKEVDAGAEEVSLVLHAPQRIQGYVLRAGQPIGFVRVALDGEGCKAEARSDKDGAFAFDRFRPGDYQLSASEGTDQASATVHAGWAWKLNPVVLSLGPGCALSGHVKAEDGEAIAGATLRVTAQIEKSSIERTLTTDAAGDFSARDLPPGSASINVEAPGFLSLYNQRASLSPGTPARLDLSLKRAVRIAGIVTGSDGRPVADVRVHVQTMAGGAWEPGWDADGHTGPTGRFELKVFAPGDYELTATHQDYRRLRQTVRAPSAELALRLDPGASVEGTVVDGAGAGVAGADVVVVPRDPQEWDDPNRAETESATSGEGGRFTIRGLVPGRYVARAFTDEAFAEANVELPAPGPIQLRLSGGHTLHGKVVDSSGAPIEGARVRAVQEGAKAPSDRGPSLRFEGRPKGDAETRADGAFSVNLLRPGRYVLSAGKDGYQQLLPLKAQTDGPEITLVLQYQGMILGRVVDEAGNPITQYLVNGYVAQDSSGAFGVYIDATGPRELVFDAGPEYARVTRTVEATLGKDFSLGTIVLATGTAVRGRVIDRETGAPITGALVGVGRPAPKDPLLGAYVSREKGAVVTGADGTFELPHVSFSVPFWIFASHPDYLLSGQPLAKGESPTLALEHGGAIEGHTLSSSGAPVQGNVFAVSPSGRQDDAAADSNGHFQILGLRAGDYRVGFVDPEQARRFPPVIVRVEPGKTANAELRQRNSGATLRVKVSASEGEAFSVLAVGTVATPTDSESLDTVLLSTIPPAEEDGFEDFTNLPPGPYTVLYGAETRDELIVATLPLEITSESRQLSLQLPKDAVRIKREIFTIDMGE